jgi:diguanylate cyclase (GGDEF)-like protein/putative nucleotidyltransferase with HDIG domain
VTIWALIPLITCLAYIILFCFSLASLKERTNRVFSFYLIVAAIWSFTSFMLHLSSSPSQALFWNEALAVALIWTLISYYNFIRVYTNGTKGRELFIGYFILLVFAALSFKGYIIQYAYVIHGVLYHNIGNGIYAIGILSITPIVVGLYLLIKKYRGSTDPADRNRTMYLIIGWSIITLLTYSNLVPKIAGLPLDHAGSLINVLIIYYSISRFQMLDIKFVVRRGLAFTLALIPLAVLFSVGLLFTLRFYSELPTYVIALVISVLVIILVVIGLPLRRPVQTLVDRAFYGETYAHRQTLLSFTSKMGNMLNLDELSSEMLQSLSKAIRISHAVLMIEDPGSSVFTVRTVYPVAKDDEKDQFTLSFDSPVVTWLEKESNVLTLNQIESMPQFKALWEGERENLHNSQLELFCPLKGHGKLIGILGLSGKHTRQIFDQEDVDLILSLANQAGVIVENAQLYSQAMTWAITDGLTRLYNHRYMHECLDKEIARNTRFGATFALIMIDIDFFKTYNDTYGHLAGDDVLASIARCIQSSIRNIDQAFRYGGEEFAVMLPETSTQGAYVVAERIREKIQERTFKGRASVTASLGVASWPTDGMTKEELLASADKALYTAKETGRNRTCGPYDSRSQVLMEVESDSETQRIAIGMIFALAATVDAKDHYTYGHSRKVSQYAVAMAQAMNLPPEKIAVIRTAGLLHDIGKIGIPDSILNKDGALDDQEWQQIKAHPTMGVEILRYVVELANALPIILNHHEHYDGSGYPSGTKGQDIPFEARLLSVADAYDAMTSLRPYHNQRSTQEAIEELKRCAGTTFDPELVEIFCKTLQSMIVKPDRGKLL